MTDPKPYTDLAQQSQQAVIAAVETWTKTVQEAFAALPNTASQFDATESVDKVYDFTEQVLQMQRDFTKQLISTSAAAAEKANESIAKATGSVK